MPPILETKRLRLRPPAWEDYQNIFRLGSNPNVMRFINNGRVQSAEQAKKDLERRIRLSNRNTGYWIAEQKDNRAFIGWMALKKLDKTEEVEIGYRFMEEFWGLGFATEGGKRILEYAFKELKLPKVVSVAIEANRASTRVMEKLGLNQQGKGIYYNTECVYYVITREAYLTSK